MINDGTNTRVKLGRERDAEAPREKKNDRAISSIQELLGCKKTTSTIDGV
jgi:hypothetical protein